MMLECLHKDHLGNRWLPESRFFKVSNPKEAKAHPERMGYWRYCRACHRRRNTASNRERREYVNQHVRERYHATRIGPCLYVFSPLADRGRMKVGQTVNPIKRLGHHRAANPPGLCSPLDGGPPLIVRADSSEEVILHDQLVPWRVRGEKGHGRCEWYVVCLDSLEIVRSFMAGRQKGSMVAPEPVFGDDQLTLGMSREVVSGTHKE